MLLVCPVGSAGADPKDSGVWVRGEGSLNRVLFYLGSGDKTSRNLKRGVNFL